MLLTSMTVDAKDFATRTGWDVKPEGACKGDACVPMPASVWAGGGVLDVSVLADRLGMPVVTHDDGLLALGPETAVTGRALSSAAAPDFTLPDVDGKPFTLSSLRGQRVVMVAWASW